MVLTATPATGEYVILAGRPVHRAAIRIGETLSVNGTQHTITAVDGLTVTCIESAGRPRSLAERRAWDELGDD